MHVTKEYAQYIIYSPHIGAKTIKKSKRVINTKYRMVATSVGKRSGSIWRGAHKRLEGTGSSVSQMPWKFITILSNLQIHFLQSFCEKDRLYNKKKLQIILKKRQF